MRSCGHGLVPPLPENKGHSFVECLRSAIAVGRPITGFTQKCFRPGDEIKKFCATRFDFGEFELRHSCASVLISQKVDALVVKEVLGHSQVSLTLSAYAHLFPGADRVAASAMDAAFGG